MPNPVASHACFAVREHKRDLSEPRKERGLLDGRIIEVQHPGALLYGG